MEEQPKVYVFTRAYNAEKTIRRAVESVLNQSYQNINYVIRDNGSTDNTYAICKEYAERDSRVTLVRYAKNNILETEEDKAAAKAELDIRYGRILREQDFFCLLDADDEYLPDFFELAINFAQEQRLDIVIGGTEMYWEDGQSKASEVVHEEKICISGRGFSEYFSNYHWHMRQVWGKLFRRRVLLGTREYTLDFYRRELGDKASAGLPYGGDTIPVLFAFQKAEKIGILPGCQHYYFRQNRSVSGTLPPSRVDSIFILHQATLDFLTVKCGTVTHTNQQFLYDVYCNAVTDTIRVICDSSLTPEDKLKEYCTIAVHPLTQVAYRECKSEDAIQSRKLLVSNAILVAKDLKGQSDKELRTILQTLLPNCGRAVTGQNISVFCRHKKLLDPLFADQPEPMLRGLLRLLRKSRYEKSDILQILRLFTVDNLLLSQIDDVEFLQQYGDIYTTIWQGRQFDALDVMTGLLLDGKVSCGRRQFLQLYISLAAVLEQVPAFIFGKMQLAWNFLDENSLEECEDVVTELEDMGVADCEELDALRNEIALKSSN